MATEPSPYPRHAARVSPAKPARWLLLALLAGLVSCGGDSTGPASPAEPGPQTPATGSLQVQATTTGEDPDEDGYLVRVGPDERRIGPNGSTTFSGLAVASHMVTLSDVQGNCEPDATERSVAVEANATASVAFTIECDVVEFTYDVGDGVPAHDVALIEEGLAIARDYVERELGGDIPSAARATMKITVVADGQGTFCCWAGILTDDDGDSHLHLFFDVAHGDWLNRPSDVPWSMDDDRQQSVVHEYAHGWQFDLGCMPLGGWLDEGIAHYIGFRAMIERGGWNPQDVFDAMLRASKATGQLDRRLEELSGTSYPVWPGHIGYIALNMLVEGGPDGVLAMRTICEEVAAGASVPVAFETAFGASLDAFYADFEEWRQAQLGS